MRTHSDDRGDRYCDIFPEIGKGDINITIIQPFAGALWHRHANQADYQFVIKGSLKIGVCNAPGPLSPLDSQRKSQEIHEWKTNFQKLALESFSHYNKARHTYHTLMASDRDEKIKNIVDSPSPKCDWFYLGEKNAMAGSLYIPTGLWHGCYNYTNEPAILVYHITNKYDEYKPDEHRLSPEQMGYDYMRVIK